MASPNQSANGYEGESTDGWMVFMASLRTDSLVQHHEVAVKDRLSRHEAGVPNVPGVTGPGC